MKFNIIAFSSYLFPRQSVIWERTQKINLGNNGTNCFFLFHLRSFDNRPNETSFVFEIRFGMTKIYKRLKFKMIWRIDFISASFDIKATSKYRTSHLLVFTNGITSLINLKNVEYSSFLYFYTCRYFSWWYQVFLLLVDVFLNNQFKYSTLHSTK